MSPGMAEKKSDPSRPTLKAAHTFSYAELLQILASRDEQPPAELAEPTLSEDELDRMFG
jgi:hypothetical protein